MEPQALIVRQRGLASLRDAVGGYKASARHSETDEILDVFSAKRQRTAGYQRLEAMRSQVEPGLWEHYKSTPSDPKLYWVYDVAYLLRSEEVLVFYAPLYLTPGVQLALRPLEGNGGWLTPLPDGRPRFTKIDLPRRLVSGG